MYACEHRDATPPGPESIQWKYREAALALFLNDVPHGTKGIKRRATLRTYLNGDWRIPRLEHFCPEDCPCQGVARDDPDMFIDSCAAALVPNSCPKLERARWNQADSAVDWCGLLSHCHQLHLVIPIWIRVIRGGRAASEADFEEQAPLPHYAHLEGDNADDLGPPGLESGSQGVGPEAAAVVDIVMHEGSEAPPLDQGQADKESRWAEFNERVQAGSVEFAILPVLRSCLAVLRQCMIPHIHLTSKLLKFSSKDWCREAYSTSFNGQPQYRVLECALDNSRQTFSRRSGRGCPKRVFGRPSLRKRDL